MLQEVTTHPLPLQSSTPRLTAPMGTQLLLVGSPRANMDTKSHSPAAPSPTGGPWGTAVVSDSAHPRPGPAESGKVNFCVTAL